MSDPHSSDCWPAFAWKRCCWWDQRSLYPNDYRWAFASSFIPDSPPHERSLRTRLPSSVAYEAGRLRALLRFSP